MLNLKKTLKTTARYQKILAENGITTIKEFLQYFPRTYENRTTTKKIKEIKIENNTSISIKGQVIEKKVLPRGRKKIYEITIQDEDENLAYISYFNSYYQAKNLEKGLRYIITGKATFKYGKILFSHPEVSKGHPPESKEDEKEQHNIGRIYPIYPELQGIKPGRFAKKMWIAKDLAGEYFSEHFPDEFLSKFKLINTVETIKNIHYPESEKKTKRSNEKNIFGQTIEDPTNISHQ